MSEHSALMGEEGITGENRNAKSYTDLSRGQDVSLDPALVKFRQKDVLVLGDVPKDGWASIFEPKFKGVVNNKKLRISVAGLVIRYQPDGSDEYFTLFGIPHNSSTSLFIYHDLSEKLKNCPFKELVEEYFGMPR